MISDRLRSLIAKWARRFSTEIVDASMDSGACYRSLDIVVRDARCLDQECHRLYHTTLHGMHREGSLEWSVAYWADECVHAL